MIEAKPNLAAYARFSYLRELNGDLEGAAEAMRLAVAAGGPAPENNAYVLALLGELERRLGRTGAARRAFGEALALVPGFPAAEAGLTRLDGRTARLRGIVERLPLPEYVVALGEAELAAGDAAGARDALRAGRGRAAAPAGRGRRRRRRAGGLRGRPRLAAEGRDARPARLGQVAERARRRRARLGADAQRRRRGRLPLGQAGAQAGLARPDLARPRRASRRSPPGTARRAASSCGSRSTHGLDGYPWQAQRARRALQ